MTLETTPYVERASTPIGIAFTPFESRVEVIVRLAQRADAAGLDRVDVAEGWTHDSMVLLAELALRTSRIGLGTSVVSAWWVRAVIDAAREDRDAELPAAAEDLARDVTLMGRHDEAAATIEAWFAAGADSVHLVLPPGRREEELAEVVDTAASIVAARSPAIIDEHAGWLG